MHSCSICHFEEEATPKFCVYCGSPFVAKDAGQEVKPPPSAVPVATSATHTPESSKKTTRGQWALYSIGMAIVALVLYGQLTKDALAPSSAATPTSRLATAQPPAQPVVRVPAQETGTPVGPAVAPFEGSFSMATGDQTGELDVNMYQGSFQFGIQSEDAASGQGCRLEGTGKVEGLVFKHGPNSEQCSVTIAFFGRAAVVSTDNCGGHCGMKAGASMDGKYMLRKSP